MTVQNLDRLKRKMARLPKKMREEAGKALQKWGGDAASLARNLAPVEGGTLQGTIKSTFYADTLRVVVEAGGPATERPVENGQDNSYNYVAAIEYGTRKMAARPFFWPAVRATRKKGRGALSRAITKAAKSVAAGG